MIVIMAAGALAGLGLFLMVKVFVQPKPGVAASLARIDAGRRGESLTTTAVAEPEEKVGGIDRARLSLGARFEAEVAARGWKFT
ncbi:MAG: type II secretion system protein, partial [Nocardioidaceae bacterium]